MEIHDRPDKGMGQDRDRPGYGMARAQKRRRRSTKLTAWKRVRHLLRSRSFRERSKRLIDGIIVALVVGLIMRWTAPATSGREVIVLVPYPVETVAPPRVPLVPRGLDAAAPGGRLPVRVSARRDEVAELAEALEAQVVREVDQALARRLRVRLSSPRSRRSSRR